MKSILFLSLVLAILGLSTFAYFQFRNDHDDAVDAIGAVPADGHIVIELKHLNKFWEAYEHSGKQNPLPQIDGLQNFWSQIKMLDSLYTTSEVLFHFFESRNIVAFQGNSADKLKGWSLAFGIRNSKEQQLIENWMGAEIGTAEFLRTYDGQDIYQLPTGELYTFAAAYFVLSQDALSLEASIRHIIAKGDLLLDPNFSLVRHSASEDAPLSLYLRNIFSKESLPDGRQLWTGLDVQIEKQGIELNGIGNIPASEQKYQALLNGDALSLLDRLPYATQAFELKSAASGTNWISYVEQFLDASGNLAKRNQSLSQLEEKCNCHVQSFITPYLSGEFCMVYHDNNEKASLLMKLIDVADFQVTLERLTGQTAETYREALMIPFKYPELWPLLYPGFDGEGSYLAIIDNYAITGEQEALKRWVNQWSNGKKLTDKGALRDLADQLSSRGGDVRWYELAHLNKGQFKFLDELDANKGDHPGWLLIENDHSSDDFVYHRLIWRTNFLDQQEQVGLALKWEQLSGVSFFSAPVITQNHYTGLKEVVVQDEANNLNLYSTSGQLLWTHPVDGQIIGAVKQVDLFKNNKLQLIFNTRDQLYCIDRKGNKVEGFPVRLKSKASAELAVFDYDQKRDYRFVVPCEDGELYNYTVEGKATKGWKYKNTGSPVLALRHFKIHAKDYILCINKDGALQLLKRNGNTRLNTKATAKQYNGGKFRILTDKDVASSKLVYLDKAGSLCEAQFGLEGAIVVTDQLNPGSLCVFSDLNNDQKKDVIISDGNELKAYDHAYNLLWSKSFDYPISSEVKCFSFTQVDTKIALVLEEANQIYLLNAQGETEAHFPLYGNLPFQATDLDENGRWDLIVPTKNGTLSCYELE